MAVYSVAKKFEWAGDISEKAQSVMRMFGLTDKRLKEKSITHSCKIAIEAGNIVYITGPSGAGKSVLLRELEKGIPEDKRISLDDIELSAAKSVIDCIEGDYVESLRFLSTAGLSDCFSALKKPVELSDGQKWRFRLAKALAAKKEFIFADEFCSGLDRITAAVISYNIYKFAKRNSVVFVLAGAGDDMLGDLQPDVIVVKELSGAAEVIYRQGIGNRV